MLNRTGLIGILVFFMGVQSAWAQESPPAKPKIAVVGLHISDAPKTLNTQYMDQVAAQISTTGHAEVLTNRAMNIVLEDRNVDARRTNPSDILMEIDAELRKGEDQLYESPPKAVKIFRQLSFRLARLLRESGSNSEVWDRSFQNKMLLVRALLDSGRQDDASYTLRDTIRIFGTSREVSMNAGYHPTLVRAYERSLKSLNDERNGHLTIDSQPSGAVIVLNGQVTDHVTPYEFKDLFPGAYHVKVSTPGQVSMVHFVEVDARRKARLNIDLETEHHLVSEGTHISVRFPSPIGIKDKVVRYGTEIGKWFGVDYVIIMGVVDTSDGEKVRSYLIRVVEETRVSYQSVAIPPGQFSVDAVQRTALAMTRPWHTGGEGTGQGFANGPIIGWSLIGAGTITLGVSLYFALNYLDLQEKATSKDENEKPIFPKECPEPPNSDGPSCNPNSPSTSPYGQKTRDDWAASANSSSTISVVTGVLGALMLSGGIWALATSSDEDSQDQGALDIKLPGGGYISPVLGSERTGINLGYRF